MQTPTQAQINAALRYAGTAAGTIGTIAALVGVTDQQTAQNIVAALHAVIDDLTQLFGDLSKLSLLVIPVVTVWLAKIGYSSASPKSQIAAVQALPQAQVIVADPALAKDIPGVKVGPVQTAVKALVLFAILLGALMLSPSAHAQIKAPHVTGDIVKDVGADIKDLKGAAPAGGALPSLIPGALTLSDVATKIQAAEKTIVDKGIADTQAASLDAQLRGDIIAQPCWDAETKFLQLLPIEWVASPAIPANPGNPTANPPIPATPAVPASPGPPSEMGPALSLQVGRDLINAVTGSDKTSLKVACAAMIGDSTKIVGQLLALLGIKAGAAAVGIVIP